MPVSFEVERGPNEGPGLTTTNIIQRLEQGENFSSIVDQFELPSVDEVLALRPDEPMGISVADVLKRLNAVRVRAGTLHNAVLGYLQHDANEPVVQEIARAADWRDLKGFNDPRGYDELLRSRIYLVGYAPTAHEFICSTSSLRHVGTTSACVRLGERDPAWQSCAREVKRCKIAAHVGMRQVLGDIRLGPGPADTLDSAIDEIEWSMRTGSLPVVEGKKAILDLARQASGFRVPQKVMNLAAHKEVETLRLVRGTVLYSERGLVGLLNRTDNAAAMFQVVFGFVALHRILGESPERVIPHILTHDLGTLATYMTGTGPDMPFDPVVGTRPVATLDFTTWMNGVARAAQAGASLIEGALVLPQVERIGSGRCPVQHSAPVDSRGLPEHMQILQDEVREAYGIDLGFDIERPSIGLVAVTAAIVAAAKPGGPLHPDSVGLDAMVRHIQERIPKSSMQRLLQLARFLLKPGMHTPMAYTSDYYTEPGIIFEP